MAFGLDDAIGAGLQIINKIIPDPAQRAQMELEILKLKQAGEFKELDSRLAEIQTQTDINKQEAAHESIFVAGWRPAVGWIGAVSLGYASILEPIMRFLSKVVFHYSGDFPIIDSTITLQILFGILGLGAYRSYDKYIKTK